MKAFGKISLRRSALLLAALAVAAAGLALSTSPAAAQTGPLYVALGDSVAGQEPGTYPNKLFPYYQSTLGVTQLRNWASIGGASSETIRTEGQLGYALADINAPSDTRAVTIDIGGNDRGECANAWDTCPFRYYFYLTLSDLKAALDSDPGPEIFAAMAYYNPASGLGGEGQDSEASYDRGLLGTDLVVDCEIFTGPQVGLNDVIYQEAGRSGALLADPYSAFKEGGQSFMADSLHPNDAGHAAIADAFREASPQCPDADKLPLPTPPPGPPSNEFSFGKVKKNKKKGTAKLTVDVPGPGALALTKTKKVKADNEPAEAAGNEKLSVKARGKAKKRLAHKGKAKVQATVIFAPDGGAPAAQSKKIKLVKH